MTFENYSQPNPHIYSQNMFFKFTRARAYANIFITRFTYFVCYTLFYHFDFKVHLKENTRAHAHIYTPKNPTYIPKKKPQQPLLSPKNEITRPKMVRL